MVLVDDREEPVFQIDFLVKVSSTFFVVVEFGACMTDGGGEIITCKEMLVASVHEEFCGANSDGIAHSKHELQASLYQVAAEAGFADANLFA